MSEEEILMGNAKIGENIKKLRLLNDVSQEELAAYLKMNRVTLSYIETGSRNYTLSSKQMEDVAFFFGINSYDLYQETIPLIPLRKVLPEDRKPIGEFFRIVNNYFKMKRLENSAKVAVPENKPVN